MSGDRMPLKGCGTVSVRDPQLLVITVFDQDVRCTLLDAAACQLFMALCCVAGSAFCTGCHFSATGPTPPVPCPAHALLCLPVSVCLQAVPSVVKAVAESPLKLSPRAEGQEVLVPIPRCVRQGGAPWG